MKVINTDHHLNTDCMHVSEVIYSIGSGVAKTMIPIKTPLVYI